MNTLEFLADLAYIGERSLNTVFSYELGDLPPFYDILKKEFTGQELRHKLKIGIFVPLVYAAFC